MCSSVPFHGLLGSSKVLQHRSLATRKPHDVFITSLNPKPLNLERSLELLSLCQRAMGIDRPLPRLRGTCKHSLFVAHYICHTMRSHMLRHTSTSFCLHNVHLPSPCIGCLSRIPNLFSIFPLRNSLTALSLDPLQSPMSATSAQKVATCSGTLRG